MRKRTVVIYRSWDGDVDSYDEVDIQVPDDETDFIELETIANARALSVLLSLSKRDRKNTDEIYIRHFIDEISPRDGSWEREDECEYTFYSARNFEILDDSPELWEIASEIFNLSPVERLQLDYNNCTGRFDSHIVGKDSYIKPDDGIEIVTYFDHPYITLDDIIDDVREFLKTK